MRVSVWKFVAGAVLGVLLVSGCGLVIREDTAASGSEYSFITGNYLPAKTLVLTYDDGPDAHTMEIARFLGEQGISATFFINGNRFCQNADAVAGNCLEPIPAHHCSNGSRQSEISTSIYYPESILDEIVVLGHTIGNHSQDHCALAGELPADVVQQFQLTQDIIDRHVTVGPFFFRPPYGNWSAAADSALAHGKLVGPMGWDIGGGDWDCWRTELSVSDCGQMYIDAMNLRDYKNGIVLMHDRPEFNVGFDGPLQLTKMLVSDLTAAGFTFTKLEQVLH